MANLGDDINNRLNYSKQTLFKQAEMYQLAYEAFRYTAHTIPEAYQEPIKFKYPLGLHQSGQVLLGETEYTKEAFIQHHAILIESALPHTGVLGLVTTMESLFGDLARAIILKYPNKIGKKKQVSAEIVLKFHDVENIHNAVVNDILNELAYKSPKEFAESIQSIYGINLLEISSYHKYMELKASRDIYVHSQGVANEIYETKAGTHARAKSGQPLYLDNNYFLQSYESCLKLIEEMELKFHDIWHSEAFELNRQLLANPAQNEVVQIEEPSTEEPQN